MMHLVGKIWKLVFCHSIRIMQLVRRTWKLVLSWYTDDAAGWKNMKIGFMSQHKFQNLLYSFHASVGLQYLNHDLRAPSAPAVLKTNLTEFIPLHWQFIVKTQKTWGIPQKYKWCNMLYIFYLLFKYCIYGVMIDDWMTISRMKKKNTSVLGWTM